MPEQRSRHRPGLLLLVLLVLLPLQQVVAEAYRFNGVERVVAVSDIHGALAEFVTILEGTGLVDEELAWSGGATHLVVVGDHLDRGDYGRQVLDLLMRLQTEASAAGGRVHALNGNHEVMNLTSDLRYVSAGDYAQFGSEERDGLPPGFFERRAAFAPDGEYGRWLLAQPVAVVIDDVLFVHGGVSTVLEGIPLERLIEESRYHTRRFAEGWHALLAAGLIGDRDSYEAILARAEELRAEQEDPARRELGEAILAAWNSISFLREGPLWYRGNARCHPYTETGVVERILAQYGVRRVVIGHTPTDDRRISSRLAGRVLRADTGMNHAAYRGRPAALLIEGGEVRAWHAGEGVGPVGEEPNRSWHRPFGMSDAALEDFLLAADMVSDEPLAGAGEGARRIVLERDGQQLAAVFNSVDTAPGLQDDRWRRASARAVRYAYEVAAYRLDRLIGLEMVPVTVKRTIDGQPGALRLWVEPSYSEAERQAGGIDYRGDCNLEDKYRLMSLFDVLLFNPGHDFGYLRYDARGDLWLMDQSRAFAPARDVPGMVRRSGLRPTPQFAEALAAITPESVAPLARYLHQRQLEALVERAEQLRALD